MLAFVQPEREARLQSGRITGVKAGFPVTGRFSGVLFAEQIASGFSVCGNEKRRLVQEHEGYPEMNGHVMIPELVVRIAAVGHEQRIAPLSLEIMIAEHKRVLAEIVIMQPGIP